MSAAGIPLTRLCQVFKRVIVIGIEVVAVVLPVTLESLIFPDTFPGETFTPVDDVPVMPGFGSVAVKVTPFSAL